MLHRNGKQTKETDRIEAILKESFPDYPKKYPPMAYRYNPASIRVRLVHKSFRRKSLADREDMVQPIIESLPGKTQRDIMLLLLLSPEEAKRSGINDYFENPTPPPV
ncbi:MAG TPA: hypothetical protein VGX70_01910 [Gemmataceae bacterium]|jgi:hypothetical protein|nr:hypothetical protein [Gemmataceae bacterium]